MSVERTTNPNQRDAFEKWAQGKGHYTWLWDGRHDDSRRNGILQCVSAAPASGGIGVSNGDLLMKYKQRNDGEGFEVPSGTLYRIACCDCGLVHDFVFVSEDGRPIGIAAKRNNRATAQRRRHVTPNTERKSA